MSAQGSNAACMAHLDALAEFYATPPPPGRWSRLYARLLAHRYNCLISPSDRVLEVGCGTGELLSRLHTRHRRGLDLSAGCIAAARLAHPEIEWQVGAAESVTVQGGPFDVIVLSDVLNQMADVETALRRLHECSHSGTRLLINIHNTLWRPLLEAGSRLGLRRRQPPVSWLSRADVVNLCTLADWEVFKSFGHILLPLPLGPLSRFVNRWLAPWATWLCLAIFLVARRSGLPRRSPGVVSVVVPARNEAGSIAAVVERMPRLARETELVFVEGNSTDATWAVIEALPDRFAHGRILKLRQKGRGKGDAVREGFAAATGELLAILDADLTMPPEDLPKYVEALASRKADFANGVRLVYPMQGQAMRFANLCANKAFSIAFSWLLGQKIKDTLCGTKVLWREDYQRLDAGRGYFGDFDPFGDFDLLFGADKLNLKIMDVPIRYAERFYGQTNIQRWRHGAILLRMVVFAARRLKFV